MSRGGIFQAVDDWSRELKAYLKAEGQNWGLESRFVVWKANFSHKGLTWCLEGWLKIWRADLRFRGQIWDLEDRFEAGWLLILGLANWIEGWKGNFEALMANGGGWTEGWTFGNSSPPLCSTGHGFLGPDAQKGSVRLVIPIFLAVLMDGETCQLRVRK